MHGGRYKYSTWGVEGREGREVRGGAIDPLKEARYIWQ